jgi:hypothetical protein
MRREAPRPILDSMSIETFWAILTYVFVFGVAAAVLFVFRYWFVTLPQRHPIRRT